MKKKFADLQDQKEEINHLDELYIKIDVVDDSTLKRYNRQKKWEYGYNDEYDFVCISKDGTVGDFYKVQGLVIGIPAAPKKIHKRDSKKENQYWERMPSPDDKLLFKIGNVIEYLRRPEATKLFEDYIDKEFDNRENGFWFMNNGDPTYITGSHYFYLQWSKIDVGYPDYRDANRIFYYFWEACKADDRSYGMCYLKNRRSGFSFMSSSETVNQATWTKDARFGVLSKTGGDAKKMFTDKIVPISSKLPFFFKPIQDGSDRPKTELSYKKPASKLTKKSYTSKAVEEEDALSEFEGLDTTIDWKNTGDNSYDGEKLRLLVHDECYHPDTLIMNDNMEFVPINSLNIGDKVTVDGGAIKTIVKKTEGETESYLVNQPYGRDYIVTENHRMVLRNYHKGEIVKSAKDFYNASEYEKQHTTRVTSKGIEREDIFDGMLPYLLGLWLGDGYKNQLKIIVNQDEEPEIIHFLGYVSQIYGIELSLKRREECKAHVVDVTLKGCTKELRKIGVYGNKHIPEQYMKSSIQTRLEVLAGLLDTDGYSDKKKGVIEFGMSDENLVNQIRTLALSCGLSASEVRHKISNYGTDTYRVWISGDLAIIPSLTEKKSFKGYNPKTTGRRNKISIEKIGIKPYVGIQVDGETDDERKLILSDFTVSLNSGKWTKPDNILNNWRVTKTCLRLGSRIIGKCMMGSTSNALSKGGEEFKNQYLKSDLTTVKRDGNDQTPTGLYSLFVPMQFGFEGYIDRYGFPVFETPEEPIDGIDGGKIRIGVLEYWNNVVQGLKDDPDTLNEHYRQFPKTEDHAFRDEAANSLFNITRIYDQIDANNEHWNRNAITTGVFQWQNGVEGSEVIFVPREGSGARFKVGWVPNPELQNSVMKKGGYYFPLNSEFGAFGCDSYDISGTVDVSRGSKGALHGLTTYNMNAEVPNSEFFLEYIARPQTAEIFFEDVRMAIHFYGMPILVENNKPRLLYYLKKKGYRGFSLNRPDRLKGQLSKTEIELGGIPNSSEDVKQTHAAVIESYIEDYVGVNEDGTMRTMPFNRTLEDWAKFDISNRTKYDATISSGLAIMANKRHLLYPKMEKIRQTHQMPFRRFEN